MLELSGKECHLLRDIAWGGSFVVGACARAVEVLNYFREDSADGRVGEIGIGFGAAAAAAKAGVNVQLELELERFPRFP